MDLSAVRGEVALRKWALQRFAGFPPARATMLVAASAAGPAADVRLDHAFAARAGAGAGVTVGRAGTTLSATELNQAAPEQRRLRDDKLINMVHALACPARGCWLHQRLPAADERRCASCNRCRRCRGATRSCMWWRGSWSWWTCVQSTARLSTTSGWRPAAGGEQVVSPIAFACRARARPRPAWPRALTSTTPPVRRVLQENDVVSFGGASAITIRGQPLPNPWVWRVRQLHEFLASYVPRAPPNQSLAPAVRAAAASGQAEASSSAQREVYSFSPVVHQRQGGQEQMGEASQGDGTVNRSHPGEDDVVVSPEPFAAQGV